MHFFERGIDGVVTDVVQRVCLATPIERGAHFFALIDDSVMRILCEFFHALEKGVSSQIMACFLLFIPEYSLDFLLSGDCGVVGARNPECAVAFHTVMPRHNVFDREHGGVPQVKCSGHIGWRKDH